MNITYQESLIYNTYPNMTVYDRYKDGVFAGWKVVPKAGYKLYDKSKDSKVIDPITLEEITEITYLVSVTLPRTYNWINFAYESVYFT